MQRIEPGTLLRLLLLWAILAGCSVGGSSLLTPTPRATITTTPTSQIPPEESNATPVPPTEPPVEGMPPLPSPAAPTAAPCLLGRWSIVHESLVGYLTEVFDQAGQITFEFQAGEGDLTLVFNQDGTCAFSADQLAIEVGLPGLASFNVMVQGDGQARYAADDLIIATWGHESAVMSEGGGEISGQVTDVAAVVVLTPEQLFIQSSGEYATGMFMDVPEDARFTQYRCTGDQLSLFVDGTLASEWTRIISE